MLPIATATHLGAVKVLKDGALSVTADGTLSVNHAHGTFYMGPLSDYEQAQYVDEWLVLHEGAMSANPRNVATLKVAPSTSNGVTFPVLVDEQPQGTITFAQGEVTGVFEFDPSTVSVTPGSIVKIGLPQMSNQENNAAGLVLILVY